jgi:hypothetical protein
MILFLGIAVYIHLIRTDDSPAEYSLVLGIVSVAVTFGSAGTGYFIFSRMLRNIREDQPLTKKLGTYRAASLIKYAMIEAPVLLNTLFYLLTGAVTFIYLTVILLLVYLTDRPSAQKIMERLPLSPEERTILDTNADF